MDRDTTAYAVKHVVFGILGLAAVAMSIAALVLAAQDRAKLKKEEHGHDAKHAHASGKGDSVSAHKHHGHPGHAGKTVEFTALDAATALLWQRDSTQPSVIVITSANCKYCKLFLPEVAKAIKALGSSLRVGTLDISQLSATKTHLTDNHKVVPQLVAVKGGSSAMKPMVGNHPAAAVQAALEIIVMQEGAAASSASL